MNMILSLGIVIFTLFVVSFLILHIKVINVSSRFSSSVFNFLLLVGFYALFVTKMKSIFLVPILGIFFLGIILKKFVLEINISKWRVTLIITSIVSFLFILLYYRDNQLLIPSEDYLFCIRVGLSNQSFGLENINVFYNTLDSSYNNPDLYHHFELWVMNLGVKLNQQHPSLNLFFFAYPLGIIISCIGIDELISKLFPNAIKNKRELFFSLIFLIMSFLFFLHPWDTFLHLTGISNLPISGEPLVWRGLKMIYVFNIIISLILYLKESNSDTFFSLLFVAFFYPPIVPIIMLTCLIWYVFLYFLGFINNTFNFLFLIGLFIGFILFYYLFGNQEVSMFSKVNLFENIKLKSLIKYSPAIIMKTLVLPLLGFFPILIIYHKKIKDIKILKMILFMILLYIMCVGVWVTYIKNIDANQVFILFFGSILPIIMIVAIWKLIFVMKSFWGYLLVIVYIFPGVVDAMNYESPIKKDSASTIQYIKKLNQTRLLYLPKESDLKSIYDFNERVYIGVNQFILYNTNIDLISVSASIKSENKRMNVSTIEMYDFYRKNSPYYKQCGYVDTSSQCFIDFLKRYKIGVICTKRADLKIDGWYKNFKNSDYYFYKPY